MGEQQVLVEVPVEEHGAASAEAAPPVVAVGKVFRDHQPGQPMLLPPSLAEWLPGEHLAAMDQLFVQVLVLCQQAGMVKLGNVALDGTKVRADASRQTNKAMSYAGMVDREPELAALVRQILDEAEQVDAEEDEWYGDARGDELPEHLKTKQARLEAIRLAKQQLEPEAADEARVKQREKAERSGEDPRRSGGRRTL